jgi:DNA ligase-1
MIEIAKAIRNVAATSGSIDKMRLLTKYQDTEGFKEILQFIYNPYIRTGIGITKLRNKKHIICHNMKYTDVIKHFTYHHNGSDADISFAWDFINSQPDQDTKMLAMEMVTKDLKIGLSAKTLNKVYGKGFIPVFDIMLGKPYQDYKHKIKGPFIETEKLDGHRRVLIKENGNCAFFTRSGIVDDGLIDLEYEARQLPDNCAYDGETLAIGNFASALELRQATNSIMNRDGVRTGVTYNIFDSLPLDEFKAGKSTQPAYIRKIFTGALFKDLSILKLADITTNVKDVIKNIGIDYDFQYITSVPIIGYVATEEDIIAHAQVIWDRKFEGTMLLQKDSYYEIKRSDKLLKVKCTESYDLPIVDFLEGTGKYEGMLGAFIVDYKGYRVGVGSGLSDSERKDFWQRKESLLGVKIEIDSFGETKSKEGGLSLNCGIYKGLRYDKGNH